MNKSFFSITVFLIILILTGCVPRMLIPQAEKVIVIPGGYDEMLKNCQFLGQIIGRNIHGEGTHFASEDRLEADDINYLKNKAAKIGANVITFTQHQIISTPQRLPSKRAYYTETLHAIQGSAYVCSMKAKEQLNRWSLSTHYTY